MHFTLSLNNKYELIKGKLEIHLSLNNKYELIKGKLEIHLVN
jgi:hypothetical protein